MTSRRSSLLRIALVCLLSAVIGGVMSAAQCQRAESDCQLAALQALSSEPASWTMWLYWPNWLPGLVFGLAYSLAVLQQTADGRMRRVLLYALGSTAAYVAAGLVFSAFLQFAGHDEFSLIFWMWPAGLAAGLVGAVLLAMAANLTLHASGSAEPALSRLWVPAVVGAGAGLVFVFVCTFGEQQILVAWPIAFSIWQISVGLSLAYRSA